MRPGRSGGIVPFVLYLSAGACIVIVIVITTINSPWRLVVSAPREDRIYLSTPISRNDTFELTYVHSVSNSAVTGNFRITDRARLDPVSTSFSSFGPGLPWLDGAAPYEISENGVMKVFHDEPAREELRLWVSPITRDRLTVHEQSYELSSWSSDEILIEIRVRR